MLDQADPNGNLWKGKAKRVFSQIDFRQRLRRVASVQAQQFEGEFGFYKLTQAVKTNPEDLKPYGVEKGWFWRDGWKKVDPKKEKLDA